MRQRDDAGARGRWSRQTEVLNVEREKCGRRGLYHLHRLIERYGVDAKLFEWSDEITADCSFKPAKSK
jgi:hypothetical protein